MSDGGLRGQKFLLGQVRRPDFPHKQETAAAISYEDNSVEYAVEQPNKRGGTRERRGGSSRNNFIL